MTNDFTTAFFEALENEDDQAALGILSAGAFGNGLDSAPSPRAAEFINNGTWDESKTLLGLVRVDSDSCFGQMPDVPSTTVGGVEQPVYKRFCGKRRDDCDARSHLAQQLPPADQLQGWYLQVSGTRNGVIWDFRFPTQEDGGPISEIAGARLLDAEHRFRMSPGQWRFLFAEWRASKVDTWGTYAPEGSRDPGAGLVVETSRPLLPSVGVEEAKDAESESEATGSNDYNANNNNDLPLSVDTSTLLQHLAALEANQASLAKDLQSTRLQYHEAILRVKQLEANKDSSLLLLNKLRSMEESQAQRGDLSAHLETIETLRFAVEHPQGALQTLKSHVAALRSHLESGGGIECHNIRFGSKTELMQWFRRHDLPVGIFCDAHALLHAIQAPVVHQDEASKNRESQAKTHMPSGLEAAVITSFDTILPSVLVGNMKAQAGGTFDCLKSYLKSQNVWDPPGRQRGVSKRIMDGVTSTQRRAETLLAATTTDPEVCALATGLVGDSAKFITQLVTWLAKQNRELTADTPYSAEEVWDMSLECLEQIFEEIHQARVSVVDAARVSPGLYLWGMLKAWEIQQRYLENSFQDDPALTGIFVRRVLLHGEDISLKTRLDKLDGSLETVEASNKSVRNDLQNVKSSVQSLKTTVNAIKK